jgi:hypothetical protein
MGDSDLCKKEVIVGKAGAGEEIWAGRDGSAGLRHWLLLLRLWDAEIPTFSQSVPSVLIPAAH